MPVKMQWSLRSTCLLWYILVPMVGTVLPIYQRDNVWRQDRPSSDNLFSLSSGNVWQDQPSLDQPRPFVSGNVWRQEPFSDSYLGGALQQWSFLDSPSPDQPSAWQLWSSHGTMSPVLPDIVDFRESFSHKKVCDFCFSLLPVGEKNVCLDFETCRNHLVFSPSKNERSGESSRCHFVPSSIIDQVCDFCLNLARPNIDLCNVYCFPATPFPCV